MRRDRAERLRRWAGPCGLAALLLFGPGAFHLARLSVTQWRLDRRLAALQHRQEQLTQEQERLTNDPTYVEGLIRNTFKLAKPGEYVIDLQDAERRGR